MEHFAGLLHGSSPACDPPENPFQLYRKTCPKDDLNQKISLNLSILNPQQSLQENSTGLLVKKKKPPILNRTIFPSKNIIGEANTLAGITRTGDQWVINAAGIVERACTLGRIRSLPKTLLDIHLSKYISKSDSDLISYPSNDHKARQNWNDSSAIQETSRRNSERTPSFTSEWEEVSIHGGRRVNKIIELHFNLAVPPKISSHIILKPCHTIPHSFIHPTAATYLPASLGLAISCQLFHLCGLREISRKLPFFEVSRDTI